MSLVLEKYDTITVVDEMLLSKFHNLAKEHFQITIKSDYDYLHSVKESIRFFSLDLPPEIKEIFIPYREAPIFWIYESHLLNQIEEFMKFNFVKGSLGDLHKSIKENYTKWVTTKLKSEKDYYATTTINFIERDVNKHNFFKHILKGIVYTYQSTLYSPEKAIELYANSIDMLESLRLNDLTKADLKYVIQLYTGFTYLREFDYIRAGTAFKEALDAKPQGCTAKIYNALAELQMNHEDVAAYLLNEVIDFDMHRLTLAIKTSNAGMFSYFFRNAFIYNIFYEKEFAKVFNHVEKILKEHRVFDISEMTKCKTKYETLKDKKYDEYYDEEIKKGLTFISKMISNYSETNNSLFFSIIPELQNKLSVIIDTIYDNIRKKYYEEVQKKLSTYDSYIEDNLHMEKKLQDELEKFKVRSKEVLAESIQRVSENSDMDMKTIEEKITELPKADRFNPQVSMSNNMTYNMIVAFVVFFMGGVSGYSNRTVSDTSEFNSIITFVLVSGFKWGIISFIIGTFVSMVIASVKVMERYEYRKKLLHRIDNIKLEKDRAIAEMKEAVSHKEKIMTENINNSITQHKKRVDELRTQRSVTEKDLIKQADEDIAKVSEGLLSLK
jgi:uncharacterized Tic20 family protein